MRLVDKLGGWAPGALLPITSSGNFNHMPTDKTRKFPTLIIALMARSCSVRLADCGIGYATQLTPSDEIFKVMLIA